MSKETGLLIKQLRENNNLSATEFAKIMNVNKSSISKWENAGQVGIENLYQIARYFRITVQELIDGRLKTEGNPDYFKRNYDLLSFDIDALIDEKDEEKLVAFYGTCLRVKTRFLKLIPMYADGKLFNTYVDEFKYLEQYVHIDNSVIPSFNYDYQSLLNKQFDKNHMAAVKEFLDKLASLTEEEQKWELSKLVDFSLDLKIKEAIETQSIEVFKSIMPLLPQSHKDFLLENNIQGKSLRDISNNRFIALMVSSGANILYSEKDVNPHEVWDEDLLSFIEGPINIEEKDDSAPTIEDFYKPNSLFSCFRYGKEWKNYCLNEYRKIINIRKTNQLMDLFALRFQKPLEYYENLIAGKYDASF